MVSLETNKNLIILPCSQTFFKSCISKSTEVQSMSMIYRKSPNFNLSQSPATLYRN